MGLHFIWIPFFHEFVYKFNAKLVLLYIMISIMFLGWGQWVQSLVLGFELIANSNQWLVFKV
jgi:hypothetical protein